MATTNETAKRIMVVPTGRPAKFEPATVAGRSGIYLGDHRLGYARVLLNGDVTPVLVHPESLVEDHGAKFCGKACDHGSPCLLCAGHQPPDRHETQHGCVFYDPLLGTVR